eukprot:TRINITY_DN8689_c0_g2_i8.p1 TRINITY_DN8689_c0_g2~~TRINITY_DN8689_c0_g2_i8.p1  ORF type:complete len:735 (+),score=165.51 TRINITY_DN8689_c0_g2_i8:1107-3311(+)
MFLLRSAKTANEKPIQVHPRMVHFLLIVRLDGLSFYERQCAMTRTAPEFTRCFTELLRRNKEIEGGAILTVSPADMFIVAKPREELKVKKINRDQEKLMYKAVRLFSKKDFLDSVTVVPGFVSKTRALMVCIEIISNGKSFVVPVEAAKDCARPNPSYSKGKHSSITRFYDTLPVRLDPHAGRTIYEWICAFLEQSLIQNYLESSRTKVVKAAEAFDSFQGISLFWKNLNQIDKVKVLLLVYTLDTRRAQEVFGGSAGGHTASAILRSTQRQDIPVHGQSLLHHPRLPAYFSVPPVARAVSEYCAKLVSGMWKKYWDTLEELDGKSRKGKQADREFEEKYVKVEPKDVAGVEMYEEFFDYDAFSLIEIFPIKGIDKKKKAKKKKKQAEAGPAIINTTEFSQCNNREMQVDPGIARHSIRGKDDELMRESSNKDVKSIESSVENIKLEEMVDIEQQDNTGKNDGESVMKVESVSEHEEESKLNAVPEVKVPNCKTPASDKPKPPHNKANKKMDKKFKKKLIEQSSKYKEEKARVFNHYKTYTSIPKEPKKKKKPATDAKPTYPNELLPTEGSYLVLPGIYNLEGIPEPVLVNLNAEIANTMNKLNAHYAVLCKAYELIVRVIEETATKVFGNGVKGRLYGSVATGLVLEDSDVDIALENIGAATNEKYIENLIVLGEYFKSQAFVKDCKTILTARVPVIKLVSPSICRVGDRGGEAGSEARQEGLEAGHNHCRQG